jgi:dolichyldiphosphatase
VQTRQLTIALMWAGQLACEAGNYVLKHAVRQARPYRALLYSMQQSAVLK